ncbi:MAG: Rieske 2Fe-2S domain-containing protein [Anaerolineae bacterium]|nr:MAG: Rieske 2Fe-2S domain-containing protein [Anaerolineae bacterium]
MKSFRLSRRQFLTWLTRGSFTEASALVIGQVIRFLSFRPAGENSTVIPAGRPKDYPRGTLTYVAEARVYVGRDTGGLYALDAVCTHLGCLVERGQKGGFKCPCHGSRFDDDGQA